MFSPGANHYFHPVAKQQRNLDFMYKAFGAKNDEWLEAQSNTELKHRPAQSAADGRESNKP